MKEEIVKKFNEDYKWVLSELKQEEIANSFSNYKFKFILKEHSDGPSPRSQKRILKMLEDKKVISLDPFFNTQMAMLDNILKMQGAEPIGYYVKFEQPSFDELLDNFSEARTLIIEKNKSEKITPDNTDSGTYFISKSMKKVLLNNVFVLATPNFSSENDNFIDYILKNPNKKLTKKDFKDSGKITLNKKFSNILNDLGFKNELKKLFFDVSKTTIYFRDSVKEEELANLNVNKVKLEEEIKTLKRVSVD